jgi:hypothetical protein
VNRLARAIFLWSVSAKRLYFTRHKLCIIMVDVKFRIIIRTNNDETDGIHLNF